MIRKRNNTSNKKVKTKSTPLRFVTRVSDFFCFIFFIFLKTICRTKKAIPSTLIRSSWKFTTIIFSCNGTNVGGAEKKRFKALTLKVQFLILLVKNFSKIGLCLETHSTNLDVWGRRLPIAAARGVSEPGDTPHGGRRLLFSLCQSLITQCWGVSLKQYFQNARYVLAFGCKNKGGHRFLNGRKKKRKL